MRCASPPESVEARRSSVRYSRPTSFRNFSRWRISTRIFSAMAVSSGDSARLSKNCLRLFDVQAAPARPGSCRPRARRALPCAGARRGTPDRARSRDTGSGRRARAACISWSRGSRRTCGRSDRPAPARPRSARRTGRRSAACPSRCGCRLPSHDLPFGLVHGSTAPSSSVRSCVGDDQVHVEIDGVAEALAARAGAHRAVEAEQRRLGFDERHAAGLALELLAEAQPLAATPRSRRSLRPTSR